MPSETASAWWGERQREGRRGGGYEGVSLKKKISLLLSKRKKRSLCVARGHHKTRMALLQVHLSSIPFWQNIMGSFLALTIILGDRLPQERLWDTACRFLSARSLL